MSASNKRKKKVKSTKRKPVNLQADFNRKCSIQSRSAATTTATNASAYLAISHEMFPDNYDSITQEQRSDGRSGGGGGSVECDSHSHNDRRIGTGDFALGDFHMHSICSDGKLKPSEVVKKAANNGVMYMSLTDHDTMAGVPEAMVAAQELNVFVIPGVEISSEVKGGENLHILGYFYPGSNNVDLEKRLEKIREGRHKRGKEMLAKLADMGIKLSWERILEIAGEAAPGRPHVAQALVEGKHVAHFREAFSRYLHNEGPAYVEGVHFPPEEAIRLIKNAGGVSALAHPWCCKDPMSLVPHLAKLGIDGIEVYHDVNKIDMYGALATESNLLRLGGSDFHGIDQTTEHAPGDIPLPFRHVELFLKHAKRVWEQPLAKRLQELASMETSENVLIWKEQVEFAIQFVESELGCRLQVVEEQGHYCHITLAAR